MRRAAELSLGGKGAWENQSGFLVNAGYIPDPEHPLICRLCPEFTFIGALLLERAQSEVAADPELARVWMRSALAVGESGIAGFAWACVDEAVFALRPGMARRNGDTMALLSLILSRVSSGFGAWLGRDAPIYAELYEFPDIARASQAVMAAKAVASRDARARAALRIAAQRDEEESLRARLDAIRPETYLSGVAFDPETLPSWWIDGLALVRTDQGMTLLEPMPDGDVLRARIESGLGAG
jgi:hypothetical protein